MPSYIFVAKTNMSLAQMTLGATSYSVGGETPSIPLRQKTYAINIMAATAVSCLVLQVMPYLLNTDQLNMGGKSMYPHPVILSPR